MSKRFMAGGAVAALAVVLASVVGLARADDETFQDERLQEGESEAVVAPEYVGSGQFYTGVCTIGPRAGDIYFNCWNLGFTSSAPRLVLCQTRNSQNQWTNWPDQFGCQVIHADNFQNGRVFVKVRRLDNNGAGWGQNLQINLLVVN